MLPLSPVRISNAVPWSSFIYRDRRLHSAVIHRSLSKEEPLSHALPSIASSVARSHNREGAHSKGRTERRRVDKSTVCLSMRQQPHRQGLVTGLIDKLDRASMASHPTDRELVFKPALARAGTKGCIRRYPRFVISSFAPLTECPPLC